MPATDLVLLQASPKAHLAAIRLNHEEWGRQCSLTQYLEREHLLCNSDMVKRHGRVSWILTHKSEVQNQVPTILASCETYIRRAKFVDQHQEKQLGDCGTSPWIPMVSLGSVFVRPAFRKLGYATTLVSLLRDQYLLLGEFSQAGMSCLYSDIGPNFYARLGWVSQACYSIECSICQTDGKNTKYDVELLDASNARTALVHMPPPTPGELKTPYIVGPGFDPEILDWFNLRSQHAFSVHTHPNGHPTNNGVRYKNTSAVVWNHAPEISTLYVLHLRYTLQDELYALLDAVEHEARSWNLSKVVAYVSFEHTGVHDKGYLPPAWQLVRRSSSLSSLMVWRNGSIVPRPADSVWLCNERYAWV